MWCDCCCLHRISSLTVRKTTVCRFVSLLYYAAPTTLKQFTLRCYYVTCLSVAVKRARTRNSSDVLVLFAYLFILHMRRMRRGKAVAWQVFLSFYFCISINRDNHFSHTVVEEFLHCRKNTLNSSEEKPTILWPTFLPKDKKAVGLWHTFLCVCPPSTFEQLVDFYSVTRLYH